MWFCNKYDPAASEEIRNNESKMFLEKNQGCQLNGSFFIDRVSGNFHISTHAFMNTFFNLRANFHELWMKMNLSYEIDDLQFGHDNQNYKIPEVKNMMRDMELKEQLFENYVDHTAYNYDNFIGGFWIELIPYTLVDHQTGLEFRSLQHSFNRKIKVL